MLVLHEIRFSPKKKKKKKCNIIAFKVFQAISKMAVPL